MYSPGSLSPQFKLTDDAMLYARVATGYQPGGPNVAFPGMPSSVDSAMLTSYELGLKSQFADRRVVLDMAAFRIDWDDIQVAASFNGLSGLINGGEASSEGVELSSQFHATENLLLGVNGVYTKARLKSDFEPIVVPQDGYDVILNSGLGGDSIPYVPEWSHPRRPSTPSPPAPASAGTSVARCAGSTNASTAPPSRPG
ncbi:TonB-dependent receptor [Pseudoxanthomonas sp. NC8]|nr:TonB-dependent receptor [Pseudoxanthomonas sp. NC8]